MAVDAVLARPVDRAVCCLNALEADCAGQHEESGPTVLHFAAGRASATRPIPARAVVIVPAHAVAVPGFVYGTLPICISEMEAVGEHGSWHIQHRTCFTASKLS
jgi:hypothetical protein